jgi:hypothetical protein
LVKRGLEPNGHDYWGNFEHSSYQYVNINGEEHRVFEEMYIIHDGEKSYDVGFISRLSHRLRLLLDENYEIGEKERRYQEYLKLQKEFSNHKNIEDAKQN